MRKVPSLETVFRDYEPKGVRFYYLYKSLAHAGLNGYVAPLTLEERLLHIAEAKRTLGTGVPWLADNMRDELRSALGDAPNSEFVLDPDGNLVRLRMWSDPDELRADLAELVGPVERPTRVEDLDLPAAPPPKLAPTGVVPGVQRQGRWAALVLEPRLEDSKHPFYVKLRAEAEPGLLRTGRGKLYLGFFVDPLHGVYWNNLVAPVRYEIEATGAAFSPASAQGPKAETESDADPREFLLDVRLNEARAPARVRFRYYACSAKWCMPVEQEYTLHWRADPALGWSMAGRTFDPRRAGGGPGDRAARLLEMDADGDGLLDPSELPPPLRERFARFDRDGDGKLSREEIEAMPAPPGPGAGPGSLDEMLRRADRDGDGSLGPDEAPAPLRERFDALDRDGDGKLSRAELEAGRPRRPAPPR